MRQPGRREEDEDPAAYRCALDSKIAVFALWWSRIWPDRNHLRAELAIMVSGERRVELVGSA
jgi:hypothetical protein